MQVETQFVLDQHQTGKRESIHFSQRSQLTRKMRNLTRKLRRKLAHQDCLQGAVHQMSVIVPTAPVVQVFHLV